MDILHLIDRLELDGGVYAGYSYDAFGTAREQTGPQTTMRFTGEQYDYKARKQSAFGGAGTPGLYYLRARYYDPTLGRFLTPDPLRGFPAAPQSLNRYAHAANDHVWLRLARPHNKQGILRVLDGGHGNLLLRSVARHIHQWRRHAKWVSSRPSH